MADGSRLTQDSRLASEFPDSSPNPRPAGQAAGAMRSADLHNIQTGGQVVGRKRKDGPSVGSRAVDRGGQGDQEQRGQGQDDPIHAWSRHHRNVRFESGGRVACVARCCSQSHWALVRRSLRSIN
jgi:hypothetical protein